MHTKLKLISVVVGLMVFLLSLLALLQIHRFQQLLIEVTSSLMSVPALALKRDVERTLAFGLQLRDNRQLKAMLEQVQKQNREIVSIHLIDADTEAGRVLWESGQPLPSYSPKRIVDAQRRAPKAMWFSDKDPTGFIQSWPVTDPIGGVVGNLVLRFDKTRPMALVESAGRYLIYVWAALCLASLLIMVPLILYLLARLDSVIKLAKSIINGSGNLDVSSGNSDIGRLAMKIAEAGKSAKSVKPANPANPANPAKGEHV